LKDTFKIETLVSTMDKDAKLLFKNMKIRSDAVIVNQQSEFEFNKYKIKNSNIREYKVNEVGVGRSRNLALMRTNGDICLVADDDMVYTDGYLEIVRRAYEKYSDADMIIFNVRIHQDSKIIEKVTKEGRVRYHNSLKYGTVTFSFKKDSIYKKNIFFSLLFGGGAKYSNGEDSLFLWQCLNKNLKVYSCTEVIADVYNDNSTWFKGYNEKFFIDRGALFRALSPKYYKILIFQFGLRKYKLYTNQMSLTKSLKLMYKGADQYKSL
jgi:glycosyltransferase involved in cell wall biosynthesis